MSSGETAHDVNPFRYVGAYGVRWQDSTLGMYRMGARFYTPQVGRFGSRDPIGYNGGLNLYGYVGNNPVAYVDPSGNSVLGILNPGTIITVGPYVLGGAAVAYGGYLIYQHYSSSHPQNASGFGGANSNPSLLHPDPAPDPLPQPCGDGGSGNDRATRCWEASDKCNRYVMKHFPCNNKEYQEALDDCMNSLWKCLMLTAMPVTFPYPKPYGSNNVMP